MNHSFHSADRSTHLKIVVVQMAEADLSKSLRVIFIFLVSRVLVSRVLVSRARWFAPGGSFRRTTAIREVPG